MKNIAILKTLIGEEAAEKCRGFRDINYALHYVQCPEVKAKLRGLRELAEDFCSAEVNSRELMNNWSAVVNYLMLKGKDLGTEQFRVLFLDRKNKLIEDVLMGEGTVDHAPVYPREVAKRALLLDATAVILTHNHPSGDPSPSAADIEMTKLIVSALKPLEIAVHDHLIIAKQGHTSLRQSGHM